MQRNIDKPIIGLDMDGVLIDFSELKQKIAAEHGFTVSRQETPSGIMKHLVPKESWGSIQEHIYYGPHALSAPIFHGVDEALAHLSQKEIPFALISRRKKPHVAEELLRIRGLWPKYFNEKNTFFVKKKEEKDRVAWSLGITHFIDDEPSVLKVMHSVPHKILFDPLGVYADMHSYKRLTSWSNFNNVLE